MQRLLDKIDPTLAKRTILVCEVGSTAYGVGSSNADTDYLGVYLPTLEETVNIWSNAKGRDTIAWRTAELREGKNAKSGATDIDVVLYSLPKFVKLAALNGNPTVTALFFGRPLYYDARGMQLRELVTKFISKQTIRAMQGYLQNQLDGALCNNKSNRPELIQQFGFDVKFAMHAYRLAAQSIELLKTYKLAIPIEDEEVKTTLLNMRNGVYTQAEAISLIEKKVIEASILFRNTDLPDAADFTYLEEWVMNLLLEYWKSNQPVVRVKPLRTAT